MQVVVVGAGFGGLSVAKELDGAGAAGLGAGEVAHSVRGIFHGRDDVVPARVDGGVDVDRRRIVLGRATTCVRRGRVRGRPAWSWNYLAWDRGARLLVAPDRPDQPC